MSKTVQSEISGASAGAEALPRTGHSTDRLAAFGVAALLLGLTTLRLSRRSVAGRS